MLAEPIQSAVAGFVATVPMTVAMLAGFKQLPTLEKYPLPPRRITRKLGRVVEVWDSLSERQKTAATLAAHFSYGAAVGSVYGTAVPDQWKNWRTGAAYGLAVWAGSYLGILPGMGLHEPATDDPPERNALMIAAHLVWGAALGGLLSLERRQSLGHSTNATEYSI